jgi:CRISPR-associated protein Csm4
MKTYLYRLDFTSPVHLGAHGIGLEQTLTTLSSDALVSALINALAVLGKADNAVAGLCSNNPPFVMSSLFPFGPDSGGKTIYTVKRPIIPPKTDPATLRDKGKDIKKLDFIKLEDLANWLGERPLSVDEIENITKVQDFMGGPEGAEIGNSESQTVKQQKPNKWWTIAMRPRVALDRQSQNSNIWFCAVLHFSSGAGLYGLVHIHSDQWFVILKQAFNLLGDMGIGGEKTYGMGLFTFKGFEPIETVVKPLPTGLSKKALLSAYYPNEAERNRLPDCLEAWDFFESKGYIVTGRDATTLKRKRVNFLSEGSVFTKTVTGAMVNVTPDAGDAMGLIHPIYRCGLAFMLP